MLIFSFSSLFLLFLTPSIYFLYLLLSLFYRFSSCSLFSWPLKLIYAYSLGWGFHPSTTSVLCVSDGSVLFSFIPPPPLSLSSSLHMLNFSHLFSFFLLSHSLPLFKRPPKWAGRRTGSTTALEIDNKM